MLVDPRKHQTQPPSDGGYGVIVAVAVRDTGAGCW